MTSISSLNMLNSVICLSMAWPTNLLLCWLILCHTNGQMRVWSQVLLQSTIIDLATPLMIFLIQIIRLSDAQNSYGMVNGPLARLAPGIAFELYHLGMCINEFSKYAMAVQYFYRWLVICRERQLSTGHYALFLCLPASVSFSLCSLIYLNRTRWNSPAAAGCLVCPPEGIIAFAVPNNASSELLSMQGLMAANIATYAIILVLSLLIWRKSRKALMPALQQSRKVNRQVSRVLLIQALFPLALTFGPSIVAFIGGVLGFTTTIGWLTLLLTQSWTSAIFPVATILIIGQYRRVVFGFFSKMLAIQSHSNTVQPQQQRNAPPIFHISNMGPNRLNMQ